MALTDQDRSYIHEVAMNSATVVSKQIIEDVVKWHIQSCPHGQNFRAVKWAIVGACVVLALSSGTSALALIKVFC